MSSHPTATVRDQIHKRLTLNLLIQGSAQHAFLTCHHLVREQLDALDGDLVPLYDRFAIAAFLQYWRGVSVLISGKPQRFWRRIDRPRHPFYGHPLLSRHGGTLAEAARQRVAERAKAKGVRTAPVVFSFAVVNDVNRIMAKESLHKHALEDIAREVAHVALGIPRHRLEAELTKQVAFGRIRPATGLRTQLLRASAAGYGGVLRDDDGRFVVVGRAWMWPLLAHELVKGTAELVCLHGLNTLDDDTYFRVTDAADRIEYEPWMLQVGAELWRRLLPLLPNDRPVAEVLMYVARLAPGALHALLNAIVEQPEWARELLAGLPKD
jgi:hypothetical protein